jgi:hypothetical protein
METTDHLRDSFIRPAPSSTNAEDHRRTRITAIGIGIFLTISLLFWWHTAR